jgi:hypothetical protein
MRSLLQGAHARYSENGEEQVLSLFFFFPARRQAGSAHKGRWSVRCSPSKGQVGDDNLFDEFDVN